jgi:transcriptional regulator with XRE-family HTH domain
VPDDPQKLFGASVRKYRKALQWSQEELAEASGLHWTYIGGIERGERNVSLQNIVKVARALKLSVSTLLKTLG